jgi:hypothetical protein
VEYLYTNEGGDTVKYTEEMIKKTIEDLNYQRDKASKYWLEKVQLKDKVFDFFNHRYNTGDEEITCSVYDVNELLESIGSEKLKSLFSVSGRISFVITDIEADSEEDARDIVESELNVEFNGDGNLDEWDIDISDTSQQ